MHVHSKILPMTRFYLRISGIRGDHSANLATTTVHSKVFNSIPFSWLKSVFDLLLYSYLVQGTTQSVWPDWTIFTDVGNKISWHKYLPTSFWGLFWKTLLSKGALLSATFWIIHGKNEPFLFQHLVTLGAQKWRLIKLTAIGVLYSCKSLMSRPTVDKVSVIWACNVPSLESHHLGPLWHIHTCRSDCGRGMCCCREFETFQFLLQCTAPVQNLINTLRS